MIQNFVGGFILVLMVINWESLNATPADKYAAPQFKTKNIILYPQKIPLKVEIADEERQRQYGLMFRRKLSSNQGMLFVFPDEALRHFWMKNTFIPLSLGFFNKNRRLIEIADLPAVKSELQTNIPSYQSIHPAQYVLEVNQGWFQRNKITTTDTYFEWAN